MNTRWKLTGDWDGNNWYQIISPEYIPHPANELDDQTASTRTTQVLLDGSKVSIARDTKFINSAITYQISVASFDEMFDYVYPISIINDTLYGIIQNIINDDISVCIEYQEYQSSWATVKAYKGYIASISQKYHMMGNPQIYSYEFTLERIDIDGTGEY